MGAKITVDSATLMNKGLEVIEARWLFDVPSEQVQVVVHPQSIVHSMVEYVDGSVIAQLGRAGHGHPDPLRADVSRPAAVARRAARPDPGRARSTFEEPDVERFPCLALARQALLDGRLRAGHPERGERGRGGRLPRGPHPLHADRRADRRGAGARARARASTASRRAWTSTPGDARGSWTRLPGGVAAAVGQRRRVATVTIHRLRSSRSSASSSSSTSSGHFIVARLSGVGVERFSIGFGPVLWRFQGKETEYCLSADPDGRLREDDGRRREPARGRQGRRTMDPAQGLQPQARSGPASSSSSRGPAMNFVLAVAASPPRMFMVSGRPVAPPWWAA